MATAMSSEDAQTLPASGAPEEGDVAPIMFEWVRRVLLSADEAEIRQHLAGMPRILLPAGVLDFQPGVEPDAPLAADEVAAPVATGCERRARLVLRGAVPGPASDALLARAAGLVEAVLARLASDRAAEEQRERERHEAYFEQLFAAAPEAIAVLDPDDRIVRTNRSFEEMFGYAPEELAGRTINELIVPPELQDEAIALTRRVAAGGHLREETIRQRKDGTRLRVLIQATPVILRGESVAVYGMYRDITAQKEAEEALRRLSTTDELTGLFNRRGFFLLAEQQRRLAIRKKAELLLLYIDVDDFKNVNDTFGHVVGDRVLADLGRLLHNCYRESDIIARVGEDGGLLARMGGDEFVVLAIDPGEEGEQILLNRLNQRLAEYNRYGQAPCPISLSIGSVRILPDPASSIDTFIAEADRRMYERKREGGES
jgi:diguanylate cyclase (GGDEF)-like protein/PAS domain S-box-containing protein